MARCERHARSKPTESFHLAEYRESDSSNWDSHSGRTSGTTGTAEKPEGGGSRTGGRYWSHSSSVPYTSATTGTGSEHGTTDESEGEAGRAGMLQRSEHKGLENEEGGVFGDCKQVAWESDYVDAAFCCKSVDIRAIWCNIPESRCWSSLCF